MLSMPNKDAEHINNISTISAAGIANIVQNIVKSNQTIQPKNPATLLLLTELSDDSIFFINCFITFCVKNVHFLQRLPSYVF
jgi:hypothetical protein